MQININNIVVPDYFSPPADGKYDAHLHYYMKHGVPAGEIRVDCNDNLTDGYIDYLILKSAGKQVIDVVEEKNVTKYVFGKHDGHPKEYVWKMPAAARDTEIEIGEKVFVETVNGPMPVTVTRVTVAGISPVPHPVKKVVRW